MYVVDNTLSIFVSHTRKKNKTLQVHEQEKCQLYSCTEHIHSNVKKLQVCMSSSTGSTHIQSPFVVHKKLAELTVCAFTTSVSNRVKSAYIHIYPIAIRERQGYDPELALGTVYVYVV